MKNIFGGCEQIYLLFINQKVYTPHKKLKNNFEQSKDVLFALKPNMATPDTSKRVQSILKNGDFSSIRDSNGWAFATAIADKSAEDGGNPLTPHQIVSVAKSYGKFYEYRDFAGQAQLRLRTGGHDNGQASNGGNQNPQQGGGSPKKQQNNQGGNHQQGGNQGGNQQQGGHFKNNNNNSPQTIADIASRKISQSNNGQQYDGAFSGKVVDVFSKPGEQYVSINQAKNIRASDNQTVVVVNFDFNEPLMPHRWVVAVWWLTLQMLWSVYEWLKSIFIAIAMIVVLGVAIYYGGGSIIQWLRDHIVPNVIIPYLQKFVNATDVA